MAHPVKTTVPVGAVVGALIGLAFHPWWMWGSVGVVAGVVYAALITLVLSRVLRWLRRGSPERYAGVTVGGTIGAIAVGLIGAISAVVRFLPTNPIESAELFATGMLGIFACGPFGFAIGGVAGGLLVALYEWLDSRFVTPLRAKSVVVDYATKTGLAIGVAVAGLVVLIFGARRGYRYGPTPPGWLVVTLLVCLLLGVFWVIRLKAKQNRESGQPDVTWLAHPHWRVIALAHALGFAGGAIGFLIGAVLHAFGWRGSPTPVQTPKKQKARAGWWRK
ncbi:MAG: hypothetical protein L0241_01225 [Planctomycetia bacterium]|nr:hypothetical protein [Planctomycetia bacterium]